MKRLFGALAVITLWVLPAPLAHAAGDPDAYMNTVAGHLGDAGVWVDPDVRELSPSETAQLDAAAKSAGAPIRIAVIPAEKISKSQSKYYSRPAWEGEEIADQLYDRVGVEGVYAVLVDASSQSNGRGLHAVQRADHGPTYFVGDAVDQAVDCCAPDYESMLERFIQRAQVVNKPFYVDAAPYAGGAAGIIGLWVTVTGLGARRARRQDEKSHLKVAQPLLNEEIIALSQQVSALPTVSDPQQSKLSKDVLDTVEKARQRLDQAKGDKDIQAVTTLLGLGPLRPSLLGRSACGRADPGADRALLLRPAARSERGRGAVEARGGRRAQRGRLRGVQAARRGRREARDLDGEGLAARAAVLGARRGPRGVRRRLLVAGRRPRVVVPGLRLPASRRGHAVALAVPSTGCALRPVQLGRRHLGGLVAQRFGRRRRREQLVQRLEPAQLLVVADAFQRWRVVPALVAPVRRVTGLLVPRAGPRCAKRPVR